jgi:transcriptional regulator with XRE-family HTH domain
MKEIGEYLRNKRIELGISLDDAEQSLKIRKKYLTAIEEGDESVLPGKTYFVGYLRNYANYLQVDQEYIDRILDKPVQTSKPVEPEPQIIRKKRTDRYFSQKRKKISVKKEKKPINVIPLLKVALVILLIGGFIFVFNQFIHTLRQPPTSMVEKEDILQEKTIEEEMLLEIARENIELEEVIEVHDVIFLPPLPEYKPIELIAKEPSWIKIIQDDQVLYEGIVAEEERIIVKSDSLISIITSSPNHINVSYNNDTLEPQSLDNHRLISYQIMPENNNN